MAIRKRVIIHGRVQGVGFRSFVETHAIKRGVRGYVTNNVDGTVEAEFVGEKQDIDDMMQLVKKGPSLANVTHIDIAEEDSDTSIERYPPFHVT